MSEESKTEDSKNHVIKLTETQKSKIKSYISQIKQVEYELGLYTQSIMDGSGAKAGHYDFNEDLDLQLQTPIKTDDNKEENMEEATEHREDASGDE